MTKKSKTGGGKFFERMLIWGFVLLCAFPYTRLLPINSITQPYAMFFAFGMFVVFYALIPRVIFSISTPLWFSLLAAVMFFLLSIVDGISFGSLKWLASYFSAFFTFVVSAYLITVNSKTVRSALIFSLSVWVAVGLLQTVIDPTILTALTSERHSDASAALIDSGRGVFGLAHEPTHHAFHVILLVTTIINLKNKSRLLMAAICFFSVAFVAMSMSALLCIALGLSMYVFFTNFVKACYSLVAGTLIAVLLFINLPEGSRIVDLSSAVLENPAELINLDYSLNMRLGGLFAATVSTAESFFVPHGISHAQWLIDLSNYYQRFSWLVEISAEGWPSGYALVAYQLGFLSVPFFIFIARAVAAARERDSTASIMTYSAITIFLFQFYISSPMFGLLFASIFFKERLERAVY